MTIAPCNTCDRRHERPVNSKCKYFRDAVVKCQRLGVSTEDYKHYLSDLEEGVMSTPRAGAGGGGLHSPFPLMADDVLMLLQDNAECKKQLRENRRQLNTILDRLDNLSLSGNRAPVTVPVTGTTASVTTASSAHIPATTPLFTTANTMTSWSGLSSYATSSTTAPTQAWLGQSRGPAIPPPGNITHPTTTVMGGPQFGYGPWMSHMATRAQQPVTSGLPAWITSQHMDSAEPRVFQPNIQAPPGFSPAASTWATPAVSALYVTSGASVSTPTAWSAGIPVSTPVCWPGSHSQALFTDPLGGPPVNVLVDATGIKAASKKRKCVIFDIEPHLYIDNVKSATIEDVISAEMSLLESMLTLGLPVQNFTKHIRFLSDKAKVYLGSALIKYDLAVREKAELIGPSAFVYGDHEFVHSFLGMENLKPKNKPVRDQSKPSRNGRVRGLCWRFNDPRGCKRDSCQYRHECRDCTGQHSAVDCKGKSEVKK